MYPKPAKCRATHLKYIFHFRKAIMIVMLVPLIGIGVTAVSAATIPKSIVETTIIDFKKAEEDCNLEGRYLRLVKKL